MVYQFVNYPLPYIHDNKVHDIESLSKVLDLALKVYKSFVEFQLCLSYFVYEYIFFSDLIFSETKVASDRCGGFG